jgi:hypothetical protein
MNWIELLFNLAPDRGNGSTEVLILIALLVFAVGGSCISYMRRRRTPSDLG